MIDRKLSGSELIELMRSALILAKTAKNEAATVECPPESFGAIVSAIFHELCVDRRKTP